MTISIRAALIAPIPFFLLLLIGLVEPSFGWTDAVFSVGVSAACSYGFMFVAGLPTHFILRRFGWQSWAHFLPILKSIVVGRVNVFDQGSDIRNLMYFTFSKIHFDLCSYTHFSSSKIMSKVSSPAFSS